LRALGLFDRGAAQRRCVDGAEREVARAAHAAGLRALQLLPDLEWLGAAEQQVASYEDVGDASISARGKDRLEGGQVTVNIREAGDRAGGGFLADAFQSGPSCTRLQARAPTQPVGCARVPVRSELRR
jgi:hypothetical protein